MSYQSFRRVVFLVLNPDQRQTRLERAGNIAIGLLILANVLAVILESMPTMDARFGVVLARFETFSLFAFSVEYLLRVWTCVEDRGYRRAIRGRLAFMMSFYALVDLAVLPG